MVFLPQDPARARGVRKDVSRTSWPGKARRVLGWRDDSDQQFLARRDRDGVRAVHAAGVHRRATRSSRTTWRSSANFTSSASWRRSAIRYGGKITGGDNGFTFPACRARRVIYKGMLMTGAGRRNIIPDLRDPAMDIGAGAGAFAVFHEHVSELGPRASVSLHRAQRRNQHAARQHQLDARGPGEFRLGAFRRRHQEGAARHQHRRQRLGDVRQLPRIARHGRAANCRTR